MEEATTSAPVGSAKRLIITEIVLENFKSYAGVQRVGPFHKVRGVAPSQLPHTRDQDAEHSVEADTVLQPNIT